MNNVFNYCCNNDLLDNLEKIANIIIACLTLFLGFYVFVYQKNKDNQNNRLQWFKELIIQPKIIFLRNFYENLQNLQNEIRTNDIDETQKIELINKIKNEQTILRKSFLDIIQDITPELHKKIILNIDTLTDELTNVISNDEFKLCNSKTYEREIHTRIQNSDKYVLNQIFNYRG